MSSPRTPKLIGLIIVVFISMSPGIILSMLNMTPAGSAASIGAIGGGVAIIATTFKHAVWASVAMAVATFLAVGSSSSVPLAVGVFVLIGAFTGALNLKGISSAFIFVPIAAGFALAEPPALTTSVVLDGLIVGLITLGAALLPVIMVSLFLQELPKKPELSLPRRVVLGYALNLAILLGVSSYLTLRFELGQLGGWLMLTVVVIVQPTLHASWTKGVQRASGTILGFFIAVGVASSIPLPGMYFALGNIFIIVALLASAQNRPYWQYAMFLTPGIVLLNGTSTSIALTAEARLLATIAGALICLVVLLLERPLYRTIAAKAGAESY
jgi:hypothetical protein